MKVSRGPRAEIGEGGGDFSSFWDRDRGRLGGQMILFGDILGIQRWRERRDRS